MESNFSDRRIAKNTVILSIRLIITIIVGLYTTKLTLQLLGVEDYGISNVIGGIVNLSAILTGAISHATQRFLSFDLGKKDTNQFRITFSMMINIFLILCLAILIVLELIGPFVISNYIIMPQERLFAAQILFQFTILIFILNTINIPYTSAIISYEEMDVYAYLTIIDVVLKLLAVYALSITPVDKLITYGLLTAIVCFIKNGITVYYCSRKLEGCKYKYCWDKSISKRMSGFIGWTLLGTTNSAMMTNGQAILLNLFFGPLVNAAKGIADRVFSVLISFVQNIFTAVNPQIIKTYASGEIEYMKLLVLRSTKFTFYFMLVLSIPIIFNIEPLLNLWLGDEQVTADMVLFTQLMLVCGLTQVYEIPLSRTVQATGDVKRYEIVVGAITLSFLPICYVLFKLGGKAYVSIIMMSVIYFFALFYRIYRTHTILQMKYFEYIKSVLIPTVLVAIISSILCLLLPSGSKSDGIIITSCRLGLDMLVVFVVSVVVGINKNERKYLRQVVSGHVKIFG